MLAQNGKQKEISVHVKLKTNMPNTIKNQSASVKDVGLLASSSREELPFIIQGNNQLIDARIVHQLLQVGRDYSTWIKDRINEYGFKLNVDFFSAIDSPDSGNQRFSPNRGKTSPKGGRPAISVHVSINMAAELCLVERNEQGRKWRLRFIEETKKAIGITSIGKEKEILKGLKPRKINDQLLWPYREVLARTGYNIKSGSNRRQRYRGQFVKEGHLLFCTETIVTMLYTNRQAMNRRAEALQAQPVLPLDFGDTNLLGKASRLMY